MAVKGIGINADSATINGDLKLLEKYLRTFEIIGFDYVEIPVHGVDAIINGELNRKRVEILKKLLTQFNLKYTVHLPDPLNLLDPSSSKLHLDAFKASMEFTSHLGADILVYHSGRVSTKYTQDKKLLANLLKTEVDLLQQLSELATKSGITICVENGLPPLEISKTDYDYSVDIATLVGQIRAIDRDNLGIALDFGHCFIASQVYNFDYLEAIKLARPYIKHIHIHDNFGKPSSPENKRAINLLPFGEGDLHLPPGWGKIPYEAIIPLLKSYEGVFMLEIDPRYGENYQEVLNIARKLVKMMEA